MPDLSSTPSLWGRLPPVAGELAAALSDLAPVLVGEELPAESASQSFFRVRERELSDQQAALHGVLVVHRGLEDLCDAPPSGPDLALEVTGMRQSVLDPTGAAPGANHDSVPPLAVPEAGAGSSSESVRSARWVIGHQVHALFNVSAAVAVADAPRSLRVGDGDAALLRPADATVYVRGFPAAKAHASTIPADYCMAAWEDLPLLLRREVRRFRRHSGPLGTLVIRGLPVDQAALPETPAVPGSVQRQATLSAAVLTMVACGLGEPLAYPAEKSGALVQDVVSAPGQATFHGNAADGCSAGRRPQADISGASVRSSSPAWMASRCASISASSARPAASSSPRTCRMVAASSRSQAGPPTGKDPAAATSTKPASRNARGSVRP